MVGVRLLPRDFQPALQITDHYLHGLDRLQRDFLALCESQVNIYVKLIFLSPPVIVMV
jgi:hypothetical protein